MQRKRKNAKKLFKLFKGVMDLWCFIDVTLGGAVNPKFST